MKNSYKYIVRATNRFKKAAKRMAKRGKDTQKLKDVVEKLAKGDSLADAYKDHPLIGNWSGHRELHIEPDWLLIYKIEKNILILELVDTGTHSDLLQEIGLSGNSLDFRQLLQHQKYSLTSLLILYFLVLMLVPLYHLHISFLYLPYLTSRPHCTRR